MKPTIPGTYKITRADNPDEVNVAIVTKAGRGLSVLVPEYKDRVPMSDIGEDELIWERIEL